MEVYCNSLIIGIIYVVYTFTGGGGGGDVHMCVCFMLSIIGSQTPQRFILFYNALQIQMPMCALIGFT